MGLFVIFPHLSVFAFEHLISVEIMGPGKDLNDFLDNFWSILGQFLVNFRLIFFSVFLGDSFVQF